MYKMYALLALKYTNHFFKCDKITSSNASYPTFFLKNSPYGKITKAS